MFGLWFNFDPATYSNAAKQVASNDYITLQSEDPRNVDNQEAEPDANGEMNVEEGEMDEEYEEEEDEVECDMPEGGKKMKLSVQLCRKIQSDHKIKLWL